MQKADTQSEVIIIGAGPAGLGCAALLKQMGIQDDELLVFEAERVGSSFERWPKEMKMITPSFPSNGFHQTDLNAITPDTSPAFTLGKEHPSGKDYAHYLKSIVSHYSIAVREKQRISNVEAITNGAGFILTTDTGQTFKTTFLIWAGGEFSQPRLDEFDGAEYCIHNSQIGSWTQCKSNHYTIIGCYESGVDAAYHLANQGKRVTLIDSHSDASDTYDPSRVLSPYTAERLACMANSERVELVQNFKVLEVRKSGDSYELLSTTGDLLSSQGQPINCTGFKQHLGPVNALFEFDPKGVPRVNEYDESTLYRNLFLSGPQLVHRDILLCFIYKFRGRFAVPCSIIGENLALDMSILNHYQQAGMFLRDLSCCETQQCFC